MCRLARLIHIASLLCCSIADAQKPKELGVESFIYVGTNTLEKSQAKGIYLFKMRTSDDPNIPEYVTVTPLGLAAEAVNPTYLEIDAKRRLLYCVNEVDDFGGTKSGAVSSFRIDAETGKLALASRCGSMGSRPCHLALDQQGKWLLVANDSGTIAVLPVHDGKFGEETDVKPLAPEGAAHPRGVTISPDNRFVFVCDSG